MSWARYSWDQTCHLDQSIVRRERSFDTIWPFSASLTTLIFALLNLWSHIKTNCSRLPFGWKSICLRSRLLPTLRANSSRADDGSKTRDLIKTGRTWFPLITGNRVVMWDLSGTRSTVLDNEFLSNACNGYFCISWSSNSPWKIWFHNGRYCLGYNCPISDNYFRWISSRFNIRIKHRVDRKCCAWERIICFSKQNG